MKRIIEGTTYNTDTAIKIALHRKHGDDDRQVTQYRTRTGADFYLIQNYERSEGHLQTSIDAPTDDFWDEIYQVGGELGPASPARLCQGDRRRNGARLRR